MFIFCKDGEFLNKLVLIINKIKKYNGFLKGLEDINLTLRKDAGF